MKLDTSGGYDVRADFPHCGAEHYSHHRTLHGAINAGKRLAKRKVAPPSYVEVVQWVRSATHPTFDRILRWEWLSEK